MSKILELGLIIIAVAAVAVADVLLKKAAVNYGNLSGVLKNPLFFAVAALYLAQVVLFAYVFVKKAPLGIVGITQTALYALIVLGSSIVFFRERVSLPQGAGMGLALLGVFLMYL